MLCQSCALSVRGCDRCGAFLRLRPVFKVETIVVCFDADLFTRTLPLSGASCLSCGTSIVPPALRVQLVQQGAEEDRNCAKVTARVDELEGLISGNKDLVG